MKIQTKLTLLFTIIIAILLIVLNLYIYSISKSYASSDFYNQLRERTYATANVYLEEDEVSKSIFLVFLKKNLEKLPGELIRIYDIKNQPAFITDSTLPNFPVTIINSTRNEKIYKSKINDTYIYGIYYNDNQGDFVILISAIDKIGDEKLINLRNVLIIGFFFSIIIVFFLGRFFTKKMLKPVSEINRQVNKITETNLHLRLNEGNRKDELSELAMTFNNMLTRIENAFELQQNFVANASHELRTPLTSIIGNIEVTLSRPRVDEEYKTTLKTVLDEAEQLHKLSDGLLNIAQASFDLESMKMEDIRLDELLEYAKDNVQKQIPQSNMELNYEHMPNNADELIIKGNTNLLMIAFENLLENANKFSDNKKVLITLTNSKGSILITISDMGIGIPQKDLKNISQTFFRAENARTFHGSGVGLSLSQKIFHLHSGKLSILSVENKGTKVSVLIKKVKSN
ncbi:MAG: HAMP domain-containing sensor histidine kinase [Bacteroidota bacterium]